MRSPADRAATDLPERELASRASVAIGLGIPFVGILLVLPLTANTDVTVLGVPLLFAVLFAMMPICTACLWWAWRIDAPRYDDEEPTR